MSWLPACITNIGVLGGRLCNDPQTHCTDTQSYNHRVCYCQAPFLNGCTGSNPPPNCCGYTASSPIPSSDNSGPCFCCCGCFTINTQVAVASDRFEAIQNVAVGDNLWVASIAGDGYTWAPAITMFSQGTEAYAKSSTMVRVFYLVGELEEYLTVTRDQVFLMPGNKLKRADKLAPNTDVLVLADGSTALVTELEAGTFAGGVHHVATTLGPAHTLDGHLLNAQNVVCGDYALQISGLLDPRDGTLFVPGHEALPSFGTAEYLRTHTHLTGSINRVVARSPKAVAKKRAERDPKLTKFTPLADGQRIKVPASATHFVSESQAEGIAANPDFKQADPASNRGRDAVNYLFTLFGGFYPQVAYTVDMHNMLPNAYSYFDDDGKANVILALGILLAYDIDFEGFNLIIAHELAHLYGGPPSYGKYTCEGAADWAGIAAIMRNVWPNKYAYELGKDGITQLKEYFALIPPPVTGPVDRCNDISVKCRIEALEAGLILGPLPFCAGGPRAPFLEVIGATAIGVTGSSISFNTKLDIASAIDPRNYTLAPRTKITKAVVDPLDSSIVQIDAQLKDDTSYEVHVYNVLSATDEPLVDGKNTAKFDTGIPVKA